MTSVSAGPAAVIARACLPAMSPSAQWQVLASHLTVTIYGEPVTCYWGELVPDTPTASERAALATLARCGALRRVTATATAAGFATAIAAAVTAELTRLKQQRADEGDTLPDAATPRLHVDVGSYRFTGPAA